MSSCVLVLFKDRLQGTKSSCFFGMRDLPYLEAGIRNVETKTELDSTLKWCMGWGMSKIHRDYGLREKLSGVTGLKNPIEDPLFKPNSEINKPKIKKRILSVYDCFSVLWSSVEPVISTLTLEVSFFFFWQSFEIFNRKEDFICSFIYVFWASSRDTTVWTRLALHINFNHLLFARIMWHYKEFTTYLF